MTYFVQLSTPLLVHWYRRLGQLKERRRNGGEENQIGKRAITKSEFGSWWSAAYKN